MATNRSNMTVEERVKRSQELGSKAQPMPTVNELGGQVGITPGTSAISAGPLATPDQRKMMGTPAQKGAKIAALGEESQLEQATKLRTQETATEADLASRRRAAQLSQAGGVFGDKASELVQSTLQNITAQKTGTPDSSMQLKLDAATDAVKALAPDARGRVATLISAIGILQQQFAAETDQTKKDALARDITAKTLELNTELGRTASTALSSDDVTRLIGTGTVNDIIKEATGKGVVAAVGDRVTLADFEKLGTSPDELASLFGIPAPDVQNMTLSELGQRLSSLTQSEFGQTQEAVAGLTSGLLSSADKAALRDVLRSLEERGVAATETGVITLAEQVRDGNTIKIGDTDYTVEEILSAPQLTDIVSRILDKPDGEFALSVKETSPQLFDWVLASKDGLQQLITGASTAATSFKTVQEENIKLLKPLDKYRDTFAKIAPNFKMDELRSGKLTIADLPPSYQVMLNTPPEKQAAVATALSRLPPEEVGALDAGQLAALGLDRENGLWSEYLAQKRIGESLNAIPNNQPGQVAAALGWPSLDELNRVAADAILAEAITGIRHPIRDLDVNNSGTIDEADIAKLKSLITSPGKISDIVAKGQVPKSMQQVPNVGANLDIDIPSRAVMDVWRDGVISPEERDSLVNNQAIPVESLQAMLSSGKLNTPALEPLRSNITMAVNKKIDNITTSALQARGITTNLLAAVNNMAIFKEGNWDAIEKNMDEGRNALRALGDLIQSEGNPAIRGVYETFRNRLQTSINNKQKQIDEVGGRPAAKKKKQWWEKI